jgi:hypothetical protein
LSSRPVGVLVAVAAAGLTLAGCGSSSQQSAATSAAGRPDRPAQAAAPARAAAIPRVKLHEFRTSADKGFFYTLSSSEAKSAESRYKFTRLAGNLGYLSSKPFKNSITLYRLRYKPFSSYLVTASTSERDKLANSQQFVYEGILGYSAKSTTGTRLWRVANNCQWRIVPYSAVAGLVAKGWHSDGGLGYAWKTA